MAFHGICMAEHLRAYVLDLVDDALLLSDRATQVYGRSLAVALLCDDDPHDLLQTAVFLLPTRECLLLQAWVSAQHLATSLRCSRSRHLEHPDSTGVHSSSRLELRASVSRVTGWSLPVASALADQVGISNCSDIALDTICSLQGHCPRLPFFSALALGVPKPPTSGL